MTWPLTARTSELARLDELAGREATAAAVLTGPAGVGKTRLLEETAARAASRGRSVQRVVCSTASAGIPFGAFGHLLPIPDGSAIDRLELLTQARRAILGAGNGSPAFLTVDDAHLLDEGSAALVHQLAVAGQATLLLTVRSGEPTPDAVRALWKDELAERIEVANLTPSEVRELIETGLDGPVEPVTVDVFSRLSQGNPLFLRELILGARDDGTLRRSSSGSWHLSGSVTPSTRLAEIVEARLERLLPPERHLAELLALAQPLQLDVLRRLCSDTTIDALEQQHVLRVVPSPSRTTVELVHPLYAEVVSDAIPHLRRQRLAGDLADALMQPGTQRPGDLLRLASLRLEAGRGGDPELFTRAARRALANFDYQLAERLAEAAVGEGADEFESSLALGKALARQNRAAEAETWFARAAAHAADDGDRTRVALARARSLFFRGHDHGRATAVLQAASEAVTDGDRLDEIEAMQALMASLLGDLPRAAQAGDRLLSRPDATPRVVRSTLAVSVFSQVLLGRFAAARTGIAFGLAAATPQDEAGDPFLAADLLRSYGAMADAYSGQVDDAVAAAREGYAEAARQRPDVAGPWGDVLCHVLILRGEVADAAAVGERTMRLIADGDPFGVGGMTLAGWAVATAIGRDLDTTETLLRRLDDTGLCGDPRPGIFADLARARAAAATGAISQGATLAYEGGMRAIAGNHLVWGSFLLHEAVRLGRPAAVVEPLREVADRVDGELIPVMAAHAEALAAGDGAALETTSDAFAACGARLHAAEAAAQAAAEHRRGQCAARARRWAARAHTLAERCQGAWSPSLAAPAEELTPREREVSLLAARGLSSKRIAAELVVSVRTVDNHLRSVYGKLGINGRDELAEVLPVG